MNLKGHSGCLRLSDPEYQITRQVQSWSVVAVCLIPMHAVLIMHQHVPDVKLVLDTTVVVVVGLVIKL